MFSTSHACKFPPSTELPNSASGATDYLGAQAKTGELTYSDCWFSKCSFWRSNIH